MMKVSMRMQDEKRCPGLIWKEVSGVNWKGSNASCAWDTFALAHMWTELSIQCGLEKSSPTQALTSLQPGVLDIKSVIRISLFCSFWNFENRTSFRDSVCMFAQRELFGYVCCCNFCFNVCTVAIFSVTAVMTNEVEDADPTDDPDPADEHADPDDADLGGPVQNTDEKNWRKPFYTMSMTFLFICKPFTVVFEKVKKCSSYSTKMHTSHENWSDFQNSKMSKNLRLDKSLDTKYFSLSI